MIRQLVLAVLRDQRSDVDIVVGIATEHRRQRDSDALEPLGVGGNVAGASLKGVIGGLKDELDRVDQRAVKVEQHSRGPFSRHSVPVSYWRARQRDAQFTRRV